MAKRKPVTGRRGFLGKVLGGAAAAFIAPSVAKASPLPAVVPLPEPVVGPVHDEYVEASMSYSDSISPSSSHGADEADGDYPWERR